MTETDAVVWRRVDQTGLEYSKLVAVDREWYLTGTVVLVQDGLPCELRYRIVCDETWRTMSADIRGTLGAQPVTIQITNDPALGWVMNGGLCAGLEGCVDIDLSFTPSTNTLPIRRLNLDVGASADVSAAWLRFPAMTLERLDQRYTRTDEFTYRYESAGGAFIRDLRVNGSRLVLEYPGLWERVAQRSD